MEFIIWNSSLDLSKEGVYSFCEKYAADFGKTPEELKALSLLDLAAIYMTAKRSADLRIAKHILDNEIGAPIIVFSDIADFMQRKRVFSLLDSENLKEIFSCKTGLSTKFYTDGKNLRCDDLTEDGMNYHIFRKVENPKALGAFLKTYNTDTSLPSNEEMDTFSSSLVPIIDRLYDRESTRYKEWERNRPKRSKTKELQR